MRNRALRMKPPEEAVRLAAPLCTGRPIGVNLRESAANDAQSRAAPASPWDAQPDVGT